jgi:hypothetical protein
MRLGLCHHMVFFFLETLCPWASSPFLIRILVILDLGPTLIQDDVIFTNYICTDLIPNKRILADMDC